MESNGAKNPMKTPSVSKILANDQFTVLTVAEVENKNMVSMCRANQNYVPPSLGDDLSSTHW